MTNPLTEEERMAAEWAAMAEGLEPLPAPTTKRALGVAAHLMPPRFYWRLTGYDSSVRAGGPVEIDFAVERDAVIVGKALERFGIKALITQKELA